jgi:hypothetical protein
MVRYTLEQHVFLYDTDVRYGSTGKCQQKFWQFCDEVPSRQTVHSLVNKLRTMTLLIDRKQKHKCWVLTEEKLDDIGARLEHIPRKSLKHIAQETGVSNSNARRTTQLLKLRPSKTVSYTLQLLSPASRVYFCSWFLQSFIASEIDLQSTFYSYEAWFHLQGYINMQSNHYLKFIESASNPWSPTPSSESWWLVCCK